MKEHYGRAPMRHMAKSRRGGFSLLELLVSLTIIGIIVATVAPKIGRSMSQTRVQRASTVIAADIKRAFALAAQRRSPVRLSFDTAGKSMAVRNRAADTTFYVNSFNSSSEIGLTQLQATKLVIFVFPNGL